jgi:glycosyltransferase involved in cell wall biosynthesis
MTFRKLHIIGNTSSSIETFARRTTELSRYISGLARQESELARGLRSGQSISLIRVDPEESGSSNDGMVRRHTFSLRALTGQANPNNIYRASGSINDLMNHFEPLIEAMRKILIEESADVVLLGGTYYVPWCLLQAARSTAKPVVLCYAGILSKEITHLPDDIQHVLRQMEQDFFDKSIFYIFPSDLTRKTVEGIFGKKILNYEVVFNGVPEEFLGYRESTKKPEFQVAFVGRFTSVKNPEFLLELAESLKQMGKQMDIRMVTRAEENNPLVKQLRARGVVILPPMDTSSLGDFYRKTGVVISPSVFETYGNVPLEAVSSGTPALVSRNMGVSEVFSILGLSDLITDFSDVRAVIGKMEQMLVKGVRVPVEIADKIQEGFAWPKIITRYMDICADWAFSEKKI